MRAIINCHIQFLIEGVNGVHFHTVLNTLSGRYSISSASLIFLWILVKLFSDKADFPTHKYVTTAFWGNVCCTEPGWVISSWKSCFFSFLHHFTFLSTTMLNGGNGQYWLWAVSWITSQPVHLILPPSSLYFVLPFKRLARIFLSSERLSSDTKNKTAMNYGENSNQNSSQYTKNYNLFLKNI